MLYRSAGGESAVVNVIKLSISGLWTVYSAALSSSGEAQMTAEVVLFNGSLQTFKAVIN